MALHPIQIAALSCTAALVGCLELAAVTPEGSGGFLATGGADAGGAGGSGGGAGVCGCPSGDEWTFGWMAVGDASLGAECPSSAPTRHEGGEGLTDPGCGPCACGPPVGGKCEVRRTRYADASCKIISQLDTATLTGSGCETYSSPVASVRVQLTSTTGKCAASSTPLPVKFQSPGVFCASGTTCDCDAAPAGFSRRCAAFGGNAEVACPPELPVAHSLVVAVEDTRTCTGCACGNPAGQPCSGQTATTCSNAQCAGCFSGSSCGSSVSSVQYSAGTPSTAGCPPVGTPVVAGSLSPKATLQLCCDS
ncbi:MAG: hypothetical protein IT377_04580 [Polyangiaceae bacterium]|nr:hypothetical protein [Polyangiaceae bacterium]